MPILLLILTVTTESTFQWILESLYFMYFSQMFFSRISTITSNIIMCHNQ